MVESRKTIDRARLKVLVEQTFGHLEKMEGIIREVRDMAYGWETGPESSREEMAPSLSGGDCCFRRLMAA